MLSFRPSLLVGATEDLFQAWDWFDSTIIEFGVGCFERNEVSVPCVLHWFSTLREIWREDGGLSHDSFTRSSIVDMNARLKGGTLS